MIQPAHSERQTAARDPGVPPGRARAWYRRLGEQRAQVLEKLARRATRVTIPERELIEVPLQRNLLSDVIK